MQPNNNKLSLITKAIKKNKTFFIAGHLNPDGDTIGTALALSSMLKRMGKKVYVFSKHNIPDNLKFLPGVNKIKITEKVKTKFDCAIILECLDFKRMGDLITPAQAKTVINIDHHANFNNFGDVNYIEPKAASSSEIVFNLFKYMKMRINTAEANALYVGLVTDTGQFQYNNTTPSALYMASCLLEAGVTTYHLYNKIYSSKSFSSLSLLGRSLSTLKLESSGKIAYMHITADMFKDSHSNVTETEGIINYAMKIQGVLVGILFRQEKEKNVIKVSFRSHDPYDVNKAAQHFGGGGHRNAAGFSYKGSMKSAEKEILNYLKKLV
jgi:phosphoesterase RecJ-like protein